MPPSVLNYADVKFFYISTGANVRPTNLVGQGTGLILLHDVRCTGSERRLYDCPHGGIEVGSCSSHTTDAGVACVPGKLIRI